MATSLRRTFLAVLFLTLGCGGGSAGTGAFTSGIGGQKTFGDLTPIERSQFCGAFENYLQSVFTPDVMCPYTGIYGTLDSEIAGRASCEEIESLCRDNFDEILPPLTCPADPEIELSQCLATVETVETCFNDIAEIQIANLQSLSCDIAGQFTSVEQLTAQVASDGLPDTPACNKLKLQCPPFAF